MPHKECLGYTTIHSRKLFCNARHLGTESTIEGRYVGTGTVNLPDYTVSCRYRAVGTRTSTSTSKVLYFDNDIKQDIKLICAPSVKQPSLTPYRDKDQRLSFLRRERLRILNFRCKFGLQI